MGCFHAGQPLFGKERVRPAIRGRTSPVVVVFAMTFEQDAPQATSNQTVRAAEHVRIGRVFEKNDSTGGGPGQSVKTPRRQHLP